jgi:hypothetical protein
MYFSASEHAPPLPPLPYGAPLPPSPLTPTPFGWATAGGARVMPLQTVQHVGVGDAYPPRGQHDVFASNNPGLHGLALNAHQSEALHRVVTSAAVTPNPSIRSGPAYNPQALATPSSRSAHLASHGVAPLVAAHPNDQAPNGNGGKSSSIALPQTAGGLGVANVPAIPLPNAGGAPANSAITASAASTIEPGAAMGCARSGGQGDLETLAGEIEMSTRGWSWWWLLIVAGILAVVGLVIWWIVLITRPPRVRDISVRDLHARDLAASGSTTFAGLSVFAGRSKLNNASAKALLLPPAEIGELDVQLDGSESCVSLTNQSGSVVTVHLPSAADNRGLVLLVLNESASTKFHAEPQGTDTIEGSTAIAIETSSALFVSAGITPLGSADWKQIM